jgi:predicted nucleic acid-binding Zn ribbon protein
MKWDNGRVFAGVTLRYNRAMERVSNTLQRIMVEALKRLPPEQLPEAAWDFAAGTAVAEKTQVLSCENETLVVEVPDPNWRAQLYAMVPQFLARLNRILPIKRLEYKLARPQDEPRKRF